MKVQRLFLRLCSKRPFLHVRLQREALMSSINQPEDQVDVYVRVHLRVCMCVCAFASRPGLNQDVG